MRTILSGSIGRRPSRRPGDIRRELEKALAKSDPWNKDDNDRWVCIYCGDVYDWNLEEPQEHNKDCVWVRAGGDG